MIARRIAAAAVALLLVGAGAARAGTPALERAQTLLAENRWPQVREALTPGLAALSPEERALAQLLIGRSLVREAEFYAATRRFADEVGLDYLRALAAPPPQGAPPAPPAVALFLGLHELAADQSAAAERTLRRAADDKRLPAAWRARAQLRRAVALHRLGRDEGTRALRADGSLEGRYWRTVLGLGAGTAATPAPASATERLLAACALLGAGATDGVQALLEGAELDRPDLQDGAATDRELRFHDPLALAALERIRWEQAARALEPSAVPLDAPRGALAGFYAAWSLYQLGRPDAARARLESIAAAAGGVPALRARTQILQVALAPRRAAAAELTELWQRSEADTDAVLLWAELQPREWRDAQPLAAALPARLDALGSADATKLDRANGGRWGLARLAAGADSSAVLARLSELRESASKNRIERNDPLLLLALAVANYRSASYAQSLETIFALSQAYPGLRGLHWNLQGVYAARQTAGGEARISP